jgi:RNA polymerase sigma-70 factor (ECF subfamily)
MEGELILDTARRAQSGDLEAFEMLAERHAPSLYRLAAAIVGEADARDLTQESLLAAWSGLPKLRDPDRFLPWARRILVNRCRNHLRTRSRRPSAISLAPEHDVPAAGDFRDPVHARMVLRPAFESLTPDQRALLALHYVSDLSIRECAESLGVRLGTAKSRLNAALAALRRALDTEGAGS